MKRIVAVLTALLFSIQVLSQTDPVEFNTNNGPGSAPSSNGNYAQSVDLSTGALASSIPLVSLKGRDIATSVELIYTGGQGLQLYDYASWVGNGWNLNVGGSIDRVVKGIRDEKELGTVFTSDNPWTIGWLSNDVNNTLIAPLGYQNIISSVGEAVELYHSPTKPANLTLLDDETWTYFETQYFQRSIQDYNLAANYNQHYDSEPDIFYFHFGGYSGKLVFDKTGTPMIIPKQDIKVEPAIGPFASFYNNVSAWIFTTPDGTKYIFKNSSDFTENVFVSHFTGNTSTPSTNDQEYVSSWHLSEIVSVTNNIIHFEYYSEDDFSYDSNPNVGYNPNYLSHPAQQKFSPVGANHTLLGADPCFQDASSIITVKGQKHISIIRVENTDERIEFQKAAINRADMPTTSNGLKALEFIKKYNKYNQLAKEIEFKTDDNDLSYFCSDCSNSNGFNYFRKRLKLNALKFKSVDNSQEEQVYSFSYFPIYRIPWISGAGGGEHLLDYWNFSNNEHHPFQPYSINCNSAWSDVNLTDGPPPPYSVYGRYSSLGGTQQGVLNSICYPNGSLEKIEYELNDFYDLNNQVNKNWGGLRVKRTTLINTNDIDHPQITEYSYKKENETESSGEVVPQRQVNDVQELCKGTTTLASYVMEKYLLRRSSSPREGPSDLIRYKRVIVRQPGLGKTVYVFTSYSDHPDINIEKHTFECTLIQNALPLAWPQVLDWDQPSHSYTNDIDNDAGAPMIDKSYERGLPLKITIYKEGNYSINPELLKVSETQYDYEFTPSGFAPQEILCLRVNADRHFLEPNILNQFVTLNYQIEFYKYINSWFYLKKKTTKTFDLCDNNPNTNITSIDEEVNYTVSPVHQQITKIENSNSDGYLTTQFIIYPQDYSYSTSYSTADEMSNAIIKMANEKHMHNIPVESYTWRHKPNVIGSDIIDGGFIACKELVNGIIVPTHQYSLEKTTSISFPSGGTQISGSANLTFISDPHYRPIHHYDRYDEFGRVIEEHEENGNPTSTQYDFYSNFSFAKSINAHRNYIETGDESSYCGYENIPASNARTPDNDFWNIDPNTLTYINDHTGNVAQTVYHVGSTLSRWGAGRYFSPTNQQQKFKVSAWIKTESGFGQIQGQGGQLFIRLADDGNNVTSGNNELSGDYNAADFADTYGEWKYYEAIIDLGTQLNSSNHNWSHGHFYVGSVNYDHTYNFFIDDIRVQPVNSNMTTNTQDLKFDKISSSSDINNVPNYFAFNGFALPKLILNEKKEIVKEFTYKTSFCNPTVKVLIRNLSNPSINQYQTNCQILYTIPEGIYCSENVEDVINAVRTDINTTGQSQANLCNSSCQYPQEKWILDDPETGSGHCETGNFHFTCCASECYMTGYYEFIDGTTSGYVTLEENYSQEPCTCHQNDCGNGNTLTTTCPPDLVIPNYKFYYSKSSTRTRIPQVPINITNISQLDNLSGSDISVSYKYFDSFNQPIQSTAKAASPSGHDIVSFLNYNQFGRTPKQNLPFIDDEGDGAFKFNLENKLLDFYHNANAIEHSDFPYSETVSENSILGRTLESSATGETWKMGNGHTANNKYVSNPANLIRYWYPTYDNNLKINGAVSSSSMIYDASELSTTQTINSNGQVTEIFTDKKGRVVARRSKVYADATTGETTMDFTSGTSTQAGGVYTYYYTYYVYDIFGNLIYEIPSVAFKKMSINSVFNFSENDPIFKEYISASHFDKKGRQIESKQPGKNGWNFIVYNKLNQPILTQSPSQRVNNDWTFIKYDLFGRAVLSGIYSHGSSISQENMQIIVDNFSGATFESRTDYPMTNFGYSNSAFPSSSTVVNLIYYFDNYNFDLDGSSYIGVNGENPKTIFNGLSTGMKARILGTSNFLTTINYYNDADHLIETQAKNILNKWEIIMNDYDWSGKVLNSKRLHNYDFGQSSYEMKITVRNEYDFAGRLLRVFQQTGNNDPEILLSELTYNELGQVITKELHKDQNTGSSLQHIDYRYNIRGWLKSINNADLVPNDNNADDYDAFGEELFYDNSDVINIDGNQQGSFKTLPQFNGNISAIKWKSRFPSVDPLTRSQHLYVYRYDDLNRLTAGYYASDNNINPGLFTKDFNLYNEKLTYEMNGNITKLFRNGLVNSLLSTIDNLTYNYNLNSNKLASIDDAAGSNLTNDFHDITGSTDYLYDVDGNQTRDNNKGITTLYNYYDLPTTITDDNQNQMKFVYNATGVKLSETSGGTTHYYIGGIEYEDAGSGPQLKIITTQEGRARPPAPNSLSTHQFVYDYFLKDHVGNVRIILSEEIIKDDYHASMELQNSQNEEQLFENVDETRANKPPGEPADPNYSPDIKVSHLNGTNGEQVGVSKSLSVTQGDKVDIDTKYYFDNLQFSNDTITVNDLLNTLANTFIYNSNSPAGLIAEAQQNWAASTFTINQALYDFLVNAFGSSVVNDPNKPQAFLVYLFYDKNFKFNPTVSGILQVQNPNTLGDLAVLNLQMPDDGYLYIYTSNQSNKNINFNDLRITHWKGTLLEENHYYPYGMLIEGLTPKYSLLGKNNKYKYQDKEFKYDLHLNEEDFHARYYDPAVARWKVQDPASQYHNPYLAMGSNPVSMIDPSGTYSYSPIWDNNGGSPKSKWNSQNPSDGHGHYYSATEYANLLYEDGYEAGNKAMSARAVEAMRSMDQIQAQMNAKEGALRARAIALSASNARGRQIAATRQLIARAMNGPDANEDKFSVVNQSMLTHSPNENDVQSLAINTKNSPYQWRVGNKFIASVHLNRGATIEFDAKKEYDIARVFSDPERTDLIEEYNLGTSAESVDGQTASFNPQDYSKEIQRTQNFYVEMQNMSTPESVFFMWIGPGGFPSEMSFMLELPNMNPNGEIYDIRGPYER